MSSLDSTRLSPAWLPELSCRTKRAPPLKGFGAELELGAGAAEDCAGETMAEEIDETTGADPDDRMTLEEGAATDCTPEDAGELTPKLL